MSPAIHLSMHLSGSHISKAAESAAERGLKLTHLHAKSDGAPRSTGDDRPPRADFSEDCQAFADFHAGMVKAGCPATASGAGAEPHAVATQAVVALRALTVRLLEELTLTVMPGTPQDVEEASLPLVSGSSPAAPHLAAGLVGSLGTLGVTSMESLLGPSLHTWAEQWGLKVAEPDDPEEDCVDSSAGSEDGTEDQHSERFAVQRGLLLYWIWRSPEHRTMIEDEAAHAAKATCEGYGALMSEASRRQSIPVALKAVELVSHFPSLLRVGSFGTESADGVATRNHLLLEGLSKSLTATMVQHPVRCIRQSSHAAFQGIARALPSADRLDLYRSLLEDAAPAAATVVLQLLQKDFIAAQKGRPRPQQAAEVVSYPSSASVFNSHAVLGITRQWLDPDGRHGWRTGLAENLEPLGTALSILRFTLMARAASPSTDDSSSPMIGDVTTAYMRDRCLMPLGEYCTALRHQITSAADSCHPGSGVAADMQLAMLLALDRVKESTQWTLDYLQG